MIAEEERARHVRELLRVLRGETHRGGYGVGDDVVHEGCPTGARVTQPHHLHCQKRINNNNILLFQPQRTSSRSSKKMCVKASCIQSKYSFCYAFPICQESTFNDI